MYASVFKSSNKNKRKPINTENKSSGYEFASCHPIWMNFPMSAQSFQIKIWFFCKFFSDENLNETQNSKTDYWTKLTGSGETPSLAQMAT